MDPEIRALLEENHRLLADNNKILHTMRRNARIGIIFKILVWAIILGVPVFIWRLYFPNVTMATPSDMSQSMEQFQDLLRTYENLPTP